MHLIGNDVEDNSWHSTHQGKGSLRSRQLWSARFSLLSPGGPKRPKNRHLSSLLPTYPTRLKRLLRHHRKLLRPLPLAAAAIILIALAAGIIYLVSGPDYRLTPQAHLLLSIPDAKLSRAVTYDSKNQTYIINRQGMEQQAGSSAPNVLVGNPAPACTVQPCQVISLTALLSRTTAGISASRCSRSSRQHLSS